MAKVKKAATPKGKTGAVKAARANGANKVRAATSPDGGPGPAAYAAVEAEAAALPRDRLRPVRLDVRKVGNVLHGVLRVLRRPEVKAAFAKMPKALFDPARVDGLETWAHALTHARSLQAVAAAQSKTKKIPHELRDEARDTKDRMIRVVEYALAGREAVAIELESIKRGSGYLDLAEDLTRLAIVYRQHAQELGPDALWYARADADVADELAAHINAIYGQTEGDKATEMTTRIWTLAEAEYGQVKALVDFLFYEDAALRAEVPSLYSALRTRTGKGEEPEEPLEPEPEPEPEPAPVREE